MRGGTKDSAGALWHRWRRLGQGMAAGNERESVNAISAIDTGEAELEYVVETAGLTKRFNGRLAVDNVALQIPAGVAFGYLGPNGAGKTTLIRMLLGLTPATAGTMRVLGRPVPDERALAL